MRGENGVGGGVRGTLDKLLAALDPDGVSALCYAQRDFAARPSLRAWGTYPSAPMFLL